MSANPDNPNGNRQVCGNCIRMVARDSNSDGHCYHNPPVAFVAGFSARPAVGRHDPACAHFVQAVPASALSNDQVRTEAQPDNKRSIGVRTPWANPIPASQQPAGAPDEN